MFSVLASCEDAQLSLQVPQADIGVPPYAQPALDKAARQFLDVGDWGGDGGSGGDGGGSGFAGGARFALHPGPRLGLRYQKTWPLSAENGLMLRAELRAVRSTARFPDGIGVFTDPATARLWSREVAVEAGQVTDLPLQGWQALAGAGAGLAHVDAAVTSALLDVHAQKVTAYPYLLLGLSRDVGPATAFETALRVGPNRQADLAMGLSVRF